MDLNTLTDTQVVDTFHQAQRVYADATEIGWSNLTLAERLYASNAQDLSFRLRRVAITRGIAHRL